MTISWTCKNQMAVSHSSTVAEVISLDTGPKMEGLLALHLCAAVIDVLEPPASRASGDSSRQPKPKTLNARQESSDKATPNMMCITSLIFGLLSLGASIFNGSRNLFLFIHPWYEHEAFV